MCILAYTFEVEQSRLKLTGFFVLTHRHTPTKIACTFETNGLIVGLTSQNQTTVYTFAVNMPTSC